LGGNKYKNMTLQVRGVSKIESIKYAHESWDSERKKAELKMSSKKNWKLQTRLLVREGSPHH
jgi:hypothetical protein